MASELRISGIVEESIVDGPGLRFVVFTQGCPHHCPGCHNPQTHPFDGGSLTDIEAVFKQYRENPLLSGITFSGGEPFCQPGPLYELARKVKALGHTVMVYSGFTYEQLLEKAKEDEDTARLLSAADILVDGPYIEALKNLELEFRGSENQRVIDLNAMKQASERHADSRFR